MSEQEVCSLGIRDCRCCCHPPKEEPTADKVEGHWEVQLNTTLWEKIDFVPNEWQFATYPNKYRFVPAVATHTDKNGLGAGDESANHFSSPIATTPSHDSIKYGAVVAERDRIKYGAKIAMVQLREVDDIKVHSPKEEPTADKVEGHWGRRKYGSGRWEELDGDPVGLENGFIYKFFPNFVPAVATHTDEEILNYKIENQRIELNRINIQLHRTLVKMDEANSYINKLQDEVSEAKESTQPTTAASLIVELEKEFAGFLANLFNRQFIDPLIYSSVQLVNVRVVEDFIRNGGSK